MPNFVSFVYFLLNSITDKEIAYANSYKCTLVTNNFCELLNSTTDNRSANSEKIVEKVLGHTQMKCKMHGLSHVQE